MKYFTLILLLIASLAYSQVRTITVPQSHESQVIFNGTLGAHGDGIDTSAAIYVEKWVGVATLFMNGDTTNAIGDSAVTNTNTSDSCLTVYTQVYNKSLGLWTFDYAEASAGKTKLDTVNRAFVNTAGATPLNMQLGQFTEWAQGDSVRFIFSIGVGDTLGFKATIGGQ